MVNQTKILGESTEEIAGEDIDPKAEIKLEASDSIATSFDDQKTDSKEAKELIKVDLLNKLNMTDTDKKNMQKSITYLEQNNMYTEENIEKLNNVEYGVDFIKIGPTKFSREKLVPQVEFNNPLNQYDVFKSNKEGVFKTGYNGKKEYYFSADAYIDEVKKQGKKAITVDHLRTALQALPGEYVDNKAYKGGSILGNILNLSNSGNVSPGGRRCNRGEFGYLGSNSVKMRDTRNFFFDGRSRGQLSDYFNRDDACPCLFVVE